MDKGIFISGGTGTWGRAAVPVLMAQSDVSRIVVFSRDELKQAEMERDLYGSDNYHKLRFYLGDVRDESRLRLAMWGCTHVVHAAALKRIEKCEADPTEAVKTNVIGTMNVVNAAMAASVRTMIALSTDKASAPVNLYGATKLCVERLVIAANNLSGGRTKFGVVRYGNIFGSRGSVVRIWHGMKAAGAKFVPCTDLEATRFFMTIDEAVWIVLHQLFSNAPEPLRIPVGLPAYRLHDLAIAMGVGVEMTGLPPHEKRHEEMSEGYTSDRALRLSVERLKQELEILGR